jgi:hypothetical protein
MVWPPATGPKLLSALRANQPDHGQHHAIRFGQPGRWNTLRVLVDDATSFRSAMSHCANLVAIHRGPGHAPQGRRFREVSLNRAIIVMTVASWQAAVQDMVETAVAAGTSSRFTIVQLLLLGRRAGAKCDRRF